MDTGAEIWYVLFKRQWEEGIFAHICAAAVGHASAMFSRGIRICTGTGIGAALSTCIQSPNWLVHILL